MQAIKLSFLMLMIQPLLGLDFFFFSKFYNDGVCKSMEELEKYMVKSEAETPCMNTLEPLLLTAQDEPIVDFGLYLTSNQKAQLADAHAFFKTVYPGLQEHEKVYFPDLVTCVSQIPFFSFFGMLDTYGLMYSLVPTLDQNRENDLSGDDYTLMDFVDLYLDLFKALQVLLQHEYFMVDLTDDEVGIVMNTQELNTHIRGKIRHLHNFRKGAGNCKAKGMKSYATTAQNMTQFNNEPEKVEYNSVNPCQVLNMLDLWHLFIKSVTEYFNRQQKVFFSFMNCIQDMVPRHNDPQTKGAQNYCPEEIAVAWKDLNIRKGLRLTEQNALNYSAESMANFYIYVLNQMKQTYQENQVKSELKKYRADIKTKEKIKKQRQVNKGKLTELEKLERQILETSFEKSESRVMKDEKFIKNMEKMELSPTLVIDQKSQKSSLNSSVKKEDQAMKVFDIDADQQIKQIESEKQKIIDIDEHNEQILVNELEARKKEVQVKFKRIVRKALIKDRKEKIEKEAKRKEMEEIQQKKNQRKVQIGKFKPNQQTAIIETSVVSNMVDPKFNQKIIIDSQPMLQMKIEKGESSQKSSQTESQISDYQSSQSNEESPSNHSIDLFTQQPDFISDLKNEELQLNQIQILSQDSHSPKMGQIVNQFIEEVRDSSEYSKSHSQADESEDSVIMKDKAQALKNNELIMKHNLKGYVLTAASTQLEKREVSKLEKVEGVYQLRDQLVALVDEGKDDSDMEVVGLKGKIVELVGQLIEEFGEAESLVENDQSLEHYTLGNLRDDMTLGEMGYIEKLRSLQTV